MDDISRWVQDRVDAQGPPLLRSVRPLAVLRQGFDPEPAGTTVLLWHRGLRYFVTAAHVLDAFPQHSYSIATASNWITIPGPYQVTNAPGGDRDVDRVDIGFGVISDAAATQFDGCHFLSADQVVTNEGLIFEGPTRSKYMALGYPLNRFEFKRFSDQTETPNQPVLANIVPPTDHTALGLDVSTHVVAEYDHKAVVSVDGVHSSPKLTGMSGGGVFRFPIIERKFDLATPRLAGILIEQDKQARRLIATRIGLVLHLIERAG